MNKNNSASAQTNDGQSDEENNRQVTTSRLDFSMSNDNAGHSENVASLNEYETDGRHHTSNRDPPGQKSVYILPGDPEKETYRLSTFLKFPAVAPVDPCVLARHGFYYTGFKDRVKCFSCGALVQDWCINDNPKLARWHLNGCELVLGSDKSNKPIQNIRPLEFVGTFTSSIPSLDSGYASSFGSTAMSSSSSFGSTKSSIPSSSSSVPLFPSYPTGIPEELSQPGRVGGDDSHKNNVIQARTQSASNVTTLANSLHNIQIGQRNVVVQNGVPQSNGFHQQTSHYIGNNTVNTGTAKVQGLDLASVTTSKHRALITQILDLHKEEDRIKSFETWKCHAVSKEALAKSGFFYLGNLDRCQCFSCSGVLRNWRYGDNVHQEHQRHFADCKMVTNQEHRNTPLPTTFNGATAPKSNGLVEPPDPSPEEKLRLDREFPCLHPVNPHMRNFDARLQTFDRRWPSHKVLASTRHIAKSGFFFLGERDRAKCWYCNGGLQNWDPTDEPFTEHAKWFPGCEYVLRCKGVEFVKNIVSKFPNLRRPTLRNPRLDHKSGQLVNNNREQPTQIPIVDPQATRGSAGEVLQNFSPAPSGGSSKHTLLNGQVVSPFIQQVLELGITNDEVQRALKKLEQQGRSLQNVDDLLDTVFALDNETSSSSTSTPTSSSSSTLSEVQATHMFAGQGEPISVPNAQIPSQSLKRNNEMQAEQQLTAEGKCGETPSKVQKTGAGEDLNQELAELENERKCKTCHQRQADTVIIPCGHLSLCSVCSETAKRCGVCHKKIQSTLKVFLA